MKDFIVLEKSCSTLAVKAFQIRHLCTDQIVFKVL